MISGTEYAVIALVLFLVFGPERLPEVARKVGGWVREARKVATDLRLVLEHEAGSLTGPVKEITEEARRLREEGKAAFEWTGPVHDQGPTPTDSLGDLGAIEDGAPQPSTGEPSTDAPHAPRASDVTDAPSSTDGPDDLDVTDEPHAHDAGATDSTSTPDEDARGTG